MRYSQSENFSMKEIKKCHHLLKAISFYVPINSNLDWSRSHAQMPTPILQNDSIRVLFTTRDANGLSRISSVDLDLELQVIDVQPRQDPALNIGKFGKFDQHGVMCSTILQDQEKISMYYIGWDTNTDYPYSLSIGLATSDDFGDSFTKLQMDPVINAEFGNGIFSTTPFVWKDRGNLKMLYSTGKSWIRSGKDYESRYVIASATSANGEDWKPEKMANPTVLDENFSYARPTLIDLDGESHILYSKRFNLDFRTGSGGYKIEMARVVSDSRWDPCTLEFEQNDIYENFLSEMQCYAYPMSINGKKLLFMNGNNFGKSGFAIVEVLK